jgi:uroporphyrinogen-III decarboxylase
MNGRERINMAMRHLRPDRVPVMCQLSMGHYFLNTHVRPHRLWFTSEGFAEALVELQRRYRFDGILINLPGRSENALRDVLSFEETAVGEKLTWRSGDVTVVPRDDNAHHHPVDGGPLQRADFATIDPDHLESLSQLQGYIWNTYHIDHLDDLSRPGPLMEVPPYFFRTIDLVRSMVGDEASVHGEVFSPFTHFMELFGYQDALVALITDPAKAHALLDRLTESAIVWGVAQAKHGVDAVLVSSAFAGGSFVSRKMYREFVVPYERRLNDAIRAAGLPVYTHTCGKIGDRLDLMLETGTLGVDTLDPPPLGNVDLADAKRTLGDLAFIKGNMNAVAILDYETPEEVIAEATRCLTIGKPGGGYILSTACSVTPRVQPWKLELLSPLAEKIGRYHEEAKGA